MELILPDLGLIFWMTISFVVLLVVLKKFAWKPVLKMLKDREETIDNALKSAEKAKEEMASLKESNALLLAEAQQERATMISEANKLKEKIVEEAKVTARNEADRIYSENKQLIEQERQKAMNELKKEVVELSIMVASKILREELSVQEKAEKYTEQVISEIKL